MTILDDEDLPTLQREVQRLLGRCILRVQQYERLIKAMVASHKLSGPVHGLERARAAKIEDSARKTLGTLVGDLLGSYVFADETNPSEETTPDSSESVIWFAMQMTRGVSEAEFVRIESELRELVLLRNNLVHHFIDQHDLWNLDGCRAAQDALITAYDRIDRHLGQLRNWAKGMEETRQVLLDVLQSEEFNDVIVSGATADDKVNWDTTGIVRAFREAFAALAVDGWAPVEKAGEWIAKRHPEHLPAKYGCHSWREVVHNAPRLELRYIEMDGRRTACYRETTKTARSR